MKEHNVLRARVSVEGGAYPLSLLTFSVLCGLWYPYPTGGWTGGWVECTSVRMAVLQPLGYPLPLIWVGEFLVVLEILY